MAKCRCGLDVETPAVVIREEAFCSYECAGELAPYSSRLEIDRIDSEIASLTETYDKLQVALTVPKRVAPVPSAPIGGGCEVCGREPAMTLAVSSLGPVMCKYGFECMKMGAEPYKMLVVWLKKRGGREKIRDNALYGVIDATLVMADKLMKELDADVERMEV